MTARTIYCRAPAMVHGKPPSAIAHVWGPWAIQTARLFVAHFVAHFVETNSLSGNRQSARRSVRRRLGTCSGSHPGCRRGRHPAARNWRRAWLDVAGFAETRWVADPGSAGREAAALRQAGRRPLRGTVQGKIGRREPVSASFRFAESTGTSVPGGLAGPFPLVGSSNACSSFCQSRVTRPSHHAQFIG